MKTILSKTPYADNDTASAEKIDFREDANHYLILAQIEPSSLSPPCSLDSRQNMKSLIDSVADFTALRNRDEIEIIVASVMFEVICPSELTLWRLTSYGGELQLQERARLTEAGLEVLRIAVAVNEMAPLATRPALRECYQTGAHQRLGRDAQDRYGYIFPVTNERGLVGFFEMHHNDPLRSDQERLIQGLLRVYRNHLRILDYSENDELTGLFNRKTFEDYFRQLARAEASGTGSPAAVDHLDRRGACDEVGQAWLAVVDIDFFKRINDTFGHLYGDEVLVLLARLMRRSFRENDRLFRSGGEEFVVVLEHVEASSAAKSLERFRATVEAFEFPQVGRVTVSIGYTRVHAGDNGSVAFGRADEALYIAKRHGRNQVLCYETLIENKILQAKTSILEDVEMF